MGMQRLVADPSNTFALSRIVSALLEGCFHDSDQSKSPMPFCTTGGGGGVGVRGVAIGSVAGGGTNGSIGAGD